MAIIRNAISDAVRNAIETEEGSGGGGFSVVGFSNQQSGSQAASPIVYAANAVPGAQAGDLAIAVMSDEDSVSYGTATGWTLVYSDINIDGISHVSLYYKVLTDSDVSFAPTPLTADIANATAAILTVLRGVSYVGRTSSAIQTRNITTPATSSNPGVYLMVAHLKNEFVGTVTPPTGYTLISDNNYDNGNREGRTVICYKETADITESPSGFGGTSVTTNYMRTTGINLSKV